MMVRDSFQVTKKEATIVLKPLRLNWHYVVWYKNVIALFASLFVPLCLMAYWNIRTFQILLRRRYFQTPTPTPVNNSAIHPTEDNAPVAAVAVLNPNTLEIPTVRDITNSNKGNWYKHLQMQYRIYFYSETISY